MKSKEEIDDIIIRYLDGSILPTEKDILYTWIKESEENKEQFLYKYKLWKMSESHYNDYDARKEFQIITQRLHPERKILITKTRKIIYSIASIAAVITLFILINHILNQQNNNDIKYYASSNSKSDLKGDNAILILSEEKTILLENKESNVEYSSDNIIVDNDQDNSISKQDISKYNELLTPYKKRTSITFSDGSKAYLNAGSRLIYPAEFSKDKREIYIDGEIYIDVMPDKKWPFIVKTKNTDITVLGTVFNVNAYESDTNIEIALVSGIVKIESKKEKELLLKPDQLYTYNEKEKGNVRNVDASRYTLWTNGLCQFNEEKLRVILNQLEKYYGAKIDCDEKIGQFTYSGKLDLDNELHIVLSSITRMLSLTYQKIDNEEQYIIKM